MIPRSTSGDVDKWDQEGMEAQKTCIGEQVTTLGSWGSIPSSNVGRYCRTHLGAVPLHEWETTAFSHQILFHIGWVLSLGALTITPLCLRHPTLCKSQVHPTTSASSQVEHYRILVASATLAKPANYSLALRPSSKANPNKISKPPLHSQGMLNITLLNISLYSL